MTTHPNRPLRWRIALAAVWLVAAIGTAQAQEGSGVGSALGTGSAAQPAPSATLVDVEGLDIAVAGPDRPATVGETVAVRLDVPLPNGLALERIESVEPGRLEFQSRDISPAEAVDGVPRVTARIEYVAFRPGNHRIRGFDLVFRQPDGTTARRRVAGVEVPVTSVIANEQNPELRPERDGVPVRYRNYTMAWVLGIGGALVAMGLLGFLIARSRPRIVVEPPPPPPRPAHEVAFEKLDAIKRDALIQQGEVMAFYVRLSETVREYLGNRYGFDGLEMTTTEILAELQPIGLPAKHDRQSVAHLLYGCDLVKFAKGGASASEEEHALEDAYGLVQDTMLAEPEPEPADADAEPDDEEAP